MPLRSDTRRWGGLTKLLHWSVALLVIALLGVGLWMIDLPMSPDKVRVYALHKSIGITVLALMLVRIAWRAHEKSRPQMPFGMPAWERGVAWLSHVLLYVALLLMPLSGWLFNSAANFPLQWFGWFSLPALGGPDPAVKAFARAVHHWTAYTLIALVSLHVLAALKHHWFDRDETLRRMLPGRRSRR
jgi:cytochrome b561